VRRPGNLQSPHATHLVTPDRASPAWPGLLCWSLAAKHDARSVRFLGVAGPNAGSKAKLSCRQADDGRDMQLLSHVRCAKDS
jgi:hypothetical protein